MQRSLNIAIHSAKDLPDDFSSGIDMFYLPWREDKRDAIILRQGWEVGLSTPRIGSSSIRRDSYIKKRWPDAQILPIRGNIEDRIKQLDSGSFDIIIVAVAALNRLGFKERISEIILFEDLPTPEGQGALAVTFLKGHKILVHD